MKKLRAIVVDRKSLTRAEAITFRYLCEGYSRVEIADKKRFRSLSTINRQVESIALKLDAHSHAEIVGTAVALGMVRYEFRETHGLLTNAFVILLMLNITSGHIDLRRFISMPSPQPIQTPRGPRSPRPLRIIRYNGRTLRTGRQFP